MKKEETKIETKELIIDGVLTSCRIGSSKYDDVIKNRISVKSESLPYEELEKAYVNSGSRLTPNWLKEKNGYINLSSKFDIPVLDINRKELSFEDLCDKSTCIGSTVKVALNVKDGAIYPKAIMIVSEGEEKDPFACFE